MKSLYFDHCASSPMPDVVIATLTDLMKLHYANASSLHRAGTEAMRLADKARASIAERMGTKPGEVVFTSGGTEGNNLAIKGLLDRTARPAKHIVVSAVEHASVYECARQMEARGVELTIVPADRTGRVDPEDVAKAIRKTTVLVSVMHVNNETGAIQPVREIGRLVKTLHPHAKFHVDGVQAIGKIPFDWTRSGIDLYTGSAHKFGGPKGTGFLLVKEGIELAPLLSGGNQESGMRSGTLNVPAVVAMSQALRLAEEGRAARADSMYAMRQRLLARVGGIPELVVNGIGAGDAEERTATAPHVVNVSYPGMRPEVMIHLLEQEGVMVSSQSACSSKSLKPSRVLLAMGYDADRASGSLRISFGDEHTMEDVDALGDKLETVVRQLKPLERKQG